MSRKIVSHTKMSSSADSIHSELVNFSICFSKVKEIVFSVCVCVCVCVQ